MTADEAKAREQSILDRANKIDRLVDTFITELRVHVDLLKDDIENRSKTDERA